MASNYLVPPQSHVAWSQPARPVGGLEQVKSDSVNLICTLAGRCIRHLIKALSPTGDTNGCACRKSQPGNTSKPN